MKPGLIRHQPQSVDVSTPENQGKLIGRVVATITTNDMSRSKLKIVAAAVWISGGVVLLLKGSGLLMQALALRPGATWMWLAIPAGLIVGGVKAELLFEKACLKNLDRIDALEQPVIWQAYRPGFYAFLVAMILLGATLSRMALGNTAGLLAVAVLDFSLATALLGSARHFSTRR